MARLILSLAVCLLAIRWALPAVAQENQKVAQASSAPSAVDMQKLRSLKIPVILPRYIPAGFVLKHVQHENDTKFGSSYTLTYDKGNAELTVEAASGGIGDIPVDTKKTFPFESAIFGHQTVDWAPGGPDGTSTATTGWMALHKGEMPVYAVIGRGIDSQEVVKVAQSLYLAR